MVCACGAHAICFPSKDEKYITTDHYIALNFLPLVICSMHSDLHVLNDDYICLIPSFPEGLAICASWCWSFRLSNKGIGRPTIEAGTVQEAMLRVLATVGWTWTWPSCTHVVMSTDIVGCKVACLLFFSIFLFDLSQN
jgi:hypothetical protein